MRGKLLFILSISIIAISGIMFSHGGLNLTGIWEGETYVEGGPQLMLTLTLEHKESLITGTLVDDMGYIDSEITETKLEGETFTFQAVAQAPEGEIVMYLKLSVTGNTMEGEWVTEGGAYSGQWTATRGEGKQAF